jgi:hypothetical protein
VCGHAKITDLGKIRVRVSVEVALKKLLNIGTVELAGGQADIVNHQQGNILAIRA